MVVTKYYEYSISHCFISTPTRFVMKKARVKCEGITNVVSALTSRIINFQISVHKIIHTAVEWTSAFKSLMAQWHMSRHYDTNACTALIHCQCMYWLIWTYNGTDHDSLSQILYKVIGTNTYLDLVIRNIAELKYLSKIPRHIVIWNYGTPLNR